MAAMAMEAGDIITAMAGAMVMAGIAGVYMVDPAASNATHGDAGASAGDERQQDFSLRNH